VRSIRALRVPYPLALPAALVGDGDACRWQGPLLLLLLLLRPRGVPLVCRLAPVRNEANGGL